MTEGARVVAEGLCRVHPGPVVAVADVSLTLDPGEFVALTGPSGSGKTSLLSLIGALDRPTSGYVEVDGLRVSHADNLARYHRDVVGFVFQHHHLLEHLTPALNVELPLIGAGVPRRGRRERAAELLEEVGLAHAAALAADAALRPLGREPSLLVLDEVRLARLPMTFDDARARAELGYRPGPAREALARASAR